LQGHFVNDWTPEWKPIEANVSDQWPGLYRRGDGAVRAFNPPDVPIPTPLPITDWAREDRRPGRRNFAGRFSALALDLRKVACLLASAAFLERELWLNLRPVRLASGPKDRHAADVVEARYDLPIPHQPATVAIGTEVG